MDANRILAAALTGVLLLASCASEDDSVSTDATSPPNSATIATSLAPVGTALVQSYEAQTLDGRKVTIRAGDGALSSFTEDIPSEMYSIRLLAEQGDCDEIQSTGDFWASQSDESDQGLKASVFAKFAYDVHAFIQCPAQGQPAAAPAPAPVAEPVNDPQFGTCAEAVANGYGNYQNGVDPEYSWYRDADNDGWSCDDS